MKLNHLAKAEETGRNRNMGLAPIGSKTHSPFRGRVFFQMPGILELREASSKNKKAPRSARPVTLAWGRLAGVKRRADAQVLFSARLSAPEVCHGSSVRPRSGWRGILAARPGSGPAELRARSRQRASCR